MAKEYKAGDRYYLPVCVNEIDSGYLYPVRIVFNNGDGNNEGHNAIKNEPDLLLTATEIAENGLGRRCGECLPMYDEVVAERDNLKADLATQKEVNEELKAWYEEANKTASEAAEANDELKAKIADLRNRVGEQLAQIQDLNAEVHFLKEKSGKQTEEATKHAHVVLNDGTELAFTQKDTIAFYRDDVDMLFISDGDGVIAGFNRGDKPTNFAYFY